MNDYYREDIKVTLDFKSQTKLLGKAYDADLSDKEYDTRLLYNQRKPEYLQLTIYYEPSDHLVEIFEYLIENEISILEIIKPTATKNKFNTPDIFDFSKSNLIHIQESNQWEHDKKPVILIIDNIDIFVNGSYAGDGMFKLTKNIFQHLNEYIKYGGLGNYGPDDKFITENRNKKTKFGAIEFVLSFKHSYDRDYSRQNINIIRDAYLTITDESECLSNQVLFHLGNSLCLMMSFYWDKNIDFFKAHTRIIDESNYRTRKTLKLANDDIDGSFEYLLKDHYKTFYDFIEDINYEKYEANSEILKELIPRILKIKKLDDISAFMVLYNVIEKIRNHLSLKPIGEKSFTIKEEFNFIDGKDKTKEIIKNKIKELKEIVVDADKIAFEESASKKVTAIRKTGLKDQFNSLLNYLELDSKLYDINFTNLINERNRIYHGNLPKEETKSYIVHMKKLIYDMILKIIT